MSVPLRPLTTAELLDRTFHLYRNNFVLFAGIAALAALTFIAALVLLLALNFTVPRPGPDVNPRAFLGALAIYFAVIAIFYALGASLAMGATIHAVSKVHLGQPGSIRESYAKVFPRMARIIVIVLAIIVRMIGMLLLTYLALIPIGVVVGLILVATAGLAVVGTILTTLIGLGIVAVVYGLVIRVYLKYSLAIQACLLENLGISDALKRSVFLTEDSLWRIFLIHLLMGVIAFALDFVLHWPIDLFFTNASMATLVLQFLATFVANSIAFPIMTIAVALLYYDQRVRKEALDLQLMMESLDSNPSQAAAATLG